MNAIFLDVDGTLTKGQSSWERAHTAFNVLSESKVYYQLAKDKIISYHDWADLDLNLWKGKSYSILQKVANTVTLFDNVIEGIAKLKTHFDIIYLVSSGLSVFVKKIKILVQADYEISNSLTCINDVITGLKIRVTNDKDKIVNKISKRLNINLNESATIGNDFNDIGMFVSVPYSVAFNSFSVDLDRVAVDKVNSESFLDAVSALISQL